MSIYKKNGIVGLMLVALLIMALLAGCGGGADENNVDSSSEGGASGNSASFSGEWTGMQLLSEISGPDAEQYMEMEGLTLDSRLLLTLHDNSTGTADLYFADELAGSALTATAAHDRLTLSGALWGDPFEWSGTFEYDEDADEWTLTGGGDITGTTEDVVFHIVLSLNQSAADAPGGQQAEETETGSQTASVDAPLEQMLIGSWMREPSNVLVERTIRVFNADGTVLGIVAKPGSGDTEATWNTGSWEKDAPINGTWIVDGDMLIVEFENDLISFETEVRVVDANTIVIKEVHTLYDYYRLP
ncbi:MAG: hypothetical protein K0B84_02085 [Firmicutes bacterium]|nr:hypothetical protein [Bacillota bacterium]